MKFRWYRPLRALRMILRNQEEILRQMSFERAVRKLRLHGVEMPMDAADYWHGKFQVCQIRLGDLRVLSPTRGAVPIAESDLFRFLKNGDQSAFESYRKDIGRAAGMDLEYEGRDREYLAFVDRFLKEGYDIAKCAIVIRAEDNAVVDGQHRAVALRAHFGDEHRIKVVKLFRASPQ